MSAKTKMTPFARFFLMLLIVSPMAYIGASYYNGEDPIGKIKNIFVSEASDISTSEDYDSRSKADLIKVIDRLERKVEQLENRIEELESN